ncbi:unnamed protein product [Urochloa decumbens]|uniref:CCHC-type domain-containing protein n=1 Tax=Urochloa decumbens TaxID=240449 RepID=A0ABC8WPL1_9POAL
MSGRRWPAPSVWSRLGTAGGHHDAAGSRLVGSNGAGWLETLKAKAGRRCYNCLSGGHFIAACRDPPRCLLCFRFGHKAARCPRPDPQRRLASHPAAAAASSAAAASRSAPASRAAPAQRFPASTAAVSDGLSPAAADAAPSSAAAAIPATSSPGAAATSMADDAYVLYHRIREERPGHVAAGARRSEAIREEERALQSLALLAVQVDASVRLDTDRVRQEAAHQFRIPAYDLIVKKISTASFLIRFEGEHQCNRARRLSVLRVGHVGLQLLPWKRQVGARAVLSKFYYHVRICIEGVPAHARQPESVASLFPKLSFVDDLECDMEKAEEEECYRLWIWTSVPAEIPTTGTLHIEEPVQLPQQGYADSLIDLGMPMGALRIEQAKTSDYDVLIHVDRVMDYSPLPPVSSHGSPDSPISGHSDEAPEVEWPVRYPFPWRLGVPDGPGRSRSGQRRVSVHDRLGDRGRDRSPPRGGGSSGLGLRQVPPSGPHDLGGWIGGAGGGSGFYAGSSSHHGGGRHRRRGMQAVAEAWQWRPKTTCNDGGPRHHRGSSEHEINVHAKVTAAANTWIDPMIDEVWVGALAGPARLQCSVEPTATQMGSAAPVTQQVMDPVGFVSLKGNAAASTGAIATVGSSPSDVRRTDLVTVGGASRGDLAPQTQKAGDHAGTVRLPSSEQIALAQGSVAAEPEHACLLKDGGNQLPSMQAGGQGSEIAVALGDDRTVADEELIAQDAERLVTVALSEIWAQNCVGSLGEKAQEETNATPCSNGPAHGLDFDLNVGFLDVDAQPVSENMAAPERMILGTAEGRLNRDITIPRSGTRGVARFAVPLKRALLSNPPMRLKTCQAKKHTVDSASRRQGKGAVKSGMGISLDEQAATLLMKTAGVLGVNDKMTDEAKKQFGEKLATPLQEDVVGDIRAAFGIPEGGDRDALSGLLGVADEDESFA